MTQPLSTLTPGNAHDVVLRAYRASQKTRTETGLILGMCRVCTPQVVRGFPVILPRESCSCR